MKKVFRRVAVLALPLLSLMIWSCEIKDDETRFNELDRLRVLGLRSEPADVVAGETANLSALVFEPKGRSIQYAWSWCPAPGGSKAEFECLVSEPDARAAWDTLGTGTELPPYDLGAGESAQLAVPFDEDLLGDWCAALIDAGATNEELILGCLFGLEPRIRLTVTTNADELVALRSLHLAGAKADPADRNHNPAFNGELEVRQDDNDRVLEPDELLRADVRYRVKVGVDPEQAESFGKGEREKLFITWFVTPGDTREASEGERTSFVEGLNDFDALLENAWLIPASPHTQTGQLFLVLRDDRGGVDWVEYRFSIEEGK